MGAANGRHSFDSAIYTMPWGTLDPVSYTNLIQIWTEVTDVISINGIPMERSVTQVTHLRSPDKAHEKVPGFLDAGANTFRLNYYKSLIPALLGYSPGGAGAPDTAPSWGRRQWAVACGDHGIWVFTGFVKSTPVEIPEDNRITVEVTIEISGKPKFFAFA